MTITGLSVVVALLIGGIEIIGLLGEKAGIDSGPIAWIGGINLDHVVMRSAVWRWGRIEQRWTERLASPTP